MMTEDKEEPKPVQNKIEQATAAAARLEKANAKMEQLLKQQANAKAEEILSGTADAGTKQEQTKEEKQIESARKMLKGTGYDDMLFPRKK